MIRWKRVLAVATAGGLALGTVAINTTSAEAFSYGNMKQIQKRLLSGGSALELDANDPGRVNPPPRNYTPRHSGDCPRFIADNIKVNQNCLNLTDADLQGRAQAQNETSITQDPAQPGHLVASYNDYRRGDGNCYTAYSMDQGQTWTDSTVPMSFTRGDAFSSNKNPKPRQYWQAGGDTSLAFDTKGNVYLSCQVFNRGAAVSGNPDQSSALLLFRSTGNNGASWNFPGRYVAASADLRGTGASSFLDKQLLTVDNHVGSPFQDRIYVTWTEFAATGSAYIYGAFSKDYGETFSSKRLISKTSPLCTNDFGLGTERGKCNENQFSQPFTAKDGTLYVTWANFNNTVTGKDNRNQMLMAKSTDGGASFSDPVLVGDYYELPDCATYQNGQDLGRSCVPEKGKTANSVFRAANYPVGAVDPNDSSKVVVTYGSYINRHSNESNGCRPNGFSDFGLNLYNGVKQAGACNNDILLSVSSNAGRSFTGTTTDPRQLQTVTQSAGEATTDQWFQWTDFNEAGKLATSYYDRQYGNDEFDGFSDFSVSGSSDLNSFSTVRATSSSMPPPTQFSGTFWGDYTGITASAGSAYPLWSDTRDPDLFVCPGTATATTPPAVCTGSAINAAIANDQDAFMAKVTIP